MILFRRTLRQFCPQALNLAFLDPEGLELAWSTVAQLGSLRCDLIILYSQQGLTRNIGKAYKSQEDTILDRFFGTQEWRDIYSSWRDKPHKTGMHRDLMDLYKQGLYSLGYQDVKQSEEILAEPLMRNAKKNAPLYRLIFASKHPRGDDFWQKVIQRDVHGQKQMF